MKVECPTCGTSIEWNAQNIHRPFCSKRCQLIDLGQWANEENIIACDDAKEDVLMANLDIEDIEAMLHEQEPDFFTQK